MSTRDKAEKWVYDGRECKIVWVEYQISGHWCGYAQTPLRFEYDETYDLVNEFMHSLFDVHGGLTYGVDADGWVGFDCAHAGDANFGPDGEHQGIVGTTRAEWHREDVKEEVQKLADQLTLIERFVEEVFDE